MIYYNEQLRILGEQCTRLRQLETLIAELRTQGETDPGTDLQRYLIERESLEGCIEAYDDVMREKAAAIRASNSPAAEELQGLEQHLSTLADREKELFTAVCAGREAERTAQQIVDTLFGAAGWGRWDMLGGSFSNMGKYGCLENAQALVEQLRSQLQRFRTALAKVEMDAPIQRYVDDVLQLPDGILDILLVDWMVLERINDTKDRILQTKEQIGAVLSQLTTMRRTIAVERKAIEVRCNAVVRDA